MSIRSDEVNYLHADIFEVMTIQQFHNFINKSAINNDLINSNNNQHMNMNNNMIDLKLNKNNKIDLIKSQSFYSNNIAQN